MTLLRNDLPEGYPTDYVVARIRGRRGALTGDWLSSIETGPAPGFSEELLWSELLRELSWVYRQMNDRLRTIFAPLFFSFEIRTLILCLRNKGARDMGRVGEFLKHSLLCDEIQRALLTEEELAKTVSSVAACLTQVSHRFQGIEEIYGSQGVRAFEERLARTSLEYLHQSKLHPLIRSFFVHFLDQRNLLSFYKHLRWGMDEAPPYISGGTIAESTLRDILAGGKIEELEKLLKPKRVKTGDGSIEVVLLRELTAQVREAGKDVVGMGPILDYIWRRYIEVRNMGTLFYGRQLDPEALVREMIL